MGIRAKAGLLVFLIIILSSLLHISATSHHVSGNVVEKHALPSRNGHLVSVQRKGGGGGRGGGGGGRGAGGRPFIAGTAGGAAGAGVNRHESGRSSGHRRSGGRGWNSVPVQMGLCAFLGLVLLGHVWM